MAEQQRADPAVVFVRMSDELASQVAARAAEIGVSTSEWARRAFRFVLSQPIQTVREVTTPEQV